MSNSMNRVYLLGHLGNAPELRATASGGVLRMRLATNDAWYDKDRKLQERTDWHDVVMFGPRAEALSKLLGKGDALLVEGNLRTSSYEKDGATRYRTEVVARDVCLAGRKRVGTAPELESDPFGPIEDEPESNREPVAASPAEAVMVDGSLARPRPARNRGRAEEALA